jgi:hypothetical protein
LTFKGWIDRLVEERFGTPTALAKTIGLHLTPFSRGVASGTFNVVNLLKLAKVANEPPSNVLRMAGKGDVADLIESLYGGAAMTPQQREVSALLDRMDPHDRSLGVEMLRRIAAAASHSSRADLPTTSRDAESEVTAHGSRARARGRR